MSTLTRDDGQLLIQMISTWLTYTHPDEMDSDHIANAADLLHRAGVSSGEAETLFEICLPLHYDSRNAQHRVAIARFSPEDDGG